jgi:urea transport system permease protein
MRARMRTRPSEIRRETALGLVVVAVLIPFVLPALYLSLFALFLPLVIMAIAVDLLWGENHIVSFGHGAFFAGGAYIGGLILKGAPGDVVGQQTQFLQSAGQAPLLDRTLEALNGVQIAGAPFLALVIGPLVVGVAGLLIGAVMFRVGSPEVYVPLVTLGIGVIAALAFNRVPALGGSNGLSGVPSFTDDLAGTSPATVNYVFNAVWVGIVMVAYWAFRRSRAGRTWRALGDDPVRLESLGYPARRLRAYGFGASTALAALAGVLYVSSSNYMGPAFANVLFSTQALIWAAVGGVGTLLGPLIGTMAVKFGEHFLSSDLGLEESWQLFLGLLLIAVVLFAPKGLSGIEEQVRTRGRRRERPVLRGSDEGSRADRITESV